MTVVLLCDNACLLGAISLISLRCTLLPAGIPSGSETSPSEFGDGGALSDGDGPEFLVVDVANVFDVLVTEGLGELVLGEFLLAALFVLVAAAAAAPPRGVVRPLEELIGGKLVEAFPVSF